MRRVAPRGLEPIVSVCRDFWRVLASSVRPAAGPRLAVLALCGVGVVGGAGLGLAQGVSEQQIRCMQLQQELAAAQGGGGTSREDLGRIEQQIAQADRVFQGRSEEHTSELQSQSNLVCRLLLGQKSKEGRKYTRGPSAAGTCSRRGGDDGH